jgi:hypothetical protein
MIPADKPQLPHLPPDSEETSFDARLRAHDLGDLRRGRVTTLQVNVGRLCGSATSPVTTATSRPGQNAPRS